MHHSGDRFLLINLILSFFLSDSSESIQQQQFTWFTVCEFVAVVVILESGQSALNRCQNSLEHLLCVYKRIGSLRTRYGVRSNNGHWNWQKFLISVTDLTPSLWSLHQMND